MKLTLLLSLITLSTNCFSQSKGLLKTWIDKNNNALIITDSLLYKDEVGLIKRDYRISNDTIFFIEYQWADTKEFPTESAYHILKLTADSLLLTYNKKWLGKLTGEKDTLIYVDSAKLKSNIFKFDRILFQTTYISSFDVRKKLEIDRAGNVYYWDKEKKRTYYHIKLDNKQLDSLTNLLNHSRIENLPIRQLNIIIDNPGFIFTSTYKNKLLSRNLNDFPYFNWGLFEYLSEIQGRVAKGKKRTKKHDFIE